MNINQKNIQNNNYKVAVVQAAPVFMDLNASIDKAIELIEEAANKGAKLIAFSECWLPGYPWWIWLSAPANNIKYFQKYHDNCLVPGSENFDRICAAAAENNILISMGASERDHGSLYISQFLIGEDGDLIKARRKLKPTHVERTVFGEGDGSDLEVSQTSLGRIGQLNCWEHLQPLTKYAMYAMHEQVHVAAWPAFSCYPQAYSLGPELSISISRVYAAEGQCYVLAPCSVISQEMIDLLVESPEQEQLILAGGGHARIFGPDGSTLCEPIPEKDEGLLYADIDLGAITIAKSFADPVGHYSRPDVTQLLLNRSAIPPMQIITDDEEIASSAMNDDTDKADEGED